MSYGIETMLHSRMEAQEKELYGRWIGRTIDTYQIYMRTRSEADGKIDWKGVNHFSTRSVTFSSICSKHS